METAKKYLQKVLIYADETLIGAFRPCIDKKNCQLKSLEHFHKVEMENLIYNNKKQNVIIKKSVSDPIKCRKKKKHIQKISNVVLTFLKNKLYEEYIIFIAQEYNITPKQSVCLEMSATRNKLTKCLKTNKHIKKKTRKPPKNYKNLIGFEKLFEENIKNKLHSRLKTYDGSLEASAVFQTTNNNELKLFLTRQIKTEKDINNFIKKLYIMNNSRKKLVNPNVTQKNVQAIIVLNKNRKELYLELNGNIQKTLNKPILHSHIIKYDNKKFINAKMLNIKLHKLKLYTSGSYIRKPTISIVNDSINSDSSMESSTNSLISINEYSFHNILEMMKKYEENVNSNFSLSKTQSCDNIMKDTYKMLVELQLNAIEQCNQLYLAYFDTKDCWPEDKKTKFADIIKNNYGILLQLQNKAIENSVFVNKRIKNVNKFINKVAQKTNYSQSTSTLNFRQSNVSNIRNMSSTSLIKYPQNIGTISDYRINKKLSKEVKIQVISKYNHSKGFLSSDASECTSTLTIVQNSDNVHEIEVQTSQQVIEKVIKINKSCSPINLIDMQDKKCVQTDISVNKHTSIDFGGHRVQICKRNINLKMRTNTEKETTPEETPKEVESTKSADNLKKNELEKDILLSPSEKCMLNQLGEPKIHRMKEIQQALNKTQIITPEMEPNLIKEDKFMQFSSEKMKKLMSVPDETKPDELQLNKETEEHSKKDLLISDKTQQREEDSKQLALLSDVPTSKETLLKENEENIPSEVDAKMSTSELQEKMEKLSIMLQQIQGESKPKEDEIVFTSSSKKLCTIPEEPKEENKVAPKKHEFLFHIKNTLERVKERFEKNSMILKRVTDLKDNYMIATNMKKLIETANADLPGKPKFIKMPANDLASLSSSSTLKSVTRTKVEIAKNLSTSLQLLKNLNEVAKNIKSSPCSAMIKLNEIEDSIHFQRKLTPKYKCDKAHLTLTPIKNFIASNKMKVSNNAARLAALKFETRSKKSRIMPSINSKHIIDLTSSKGSKKRRLKGQKASTTAIKPPKTSSAHPTVQTTRESPLIPKIYRPVTPKNYQLDSAKLSNITLNDVAPFQPEYPRKDNLSHIEIEKTYLYKLLNNSFSEKSLEPLIKCSNVNCTSCTTLPNRVICKTKDKTQKKRREYFPKQNKTDVYSSENCLWEKMHWNTGITIQQDHDFDFKQYMDDPNLMKSQDMTVCPINVTYDKINTDVAKPGPAANEINMKKQNVVTVNKKTKAVAVKQGNPRENSTAANKTTTVAKANQNKIQKSIQQAILKNQEKFKFIEQSLTPKRSQNPPKFKKNIPNKVPKIISSGTLNNKKILWQKLSPQFSKRNEMFVRRHGIGPKIDNVFDRKYRNSAITKSQISLKLPEDAVLTEISETVKKSQDDMQKYIELVEQKFLKTFSMPETEKATAYTNLESEIKEMLHLLNNSKDKKRTIEALEIKKPEKPKSKSGSRPVSAKILKKSSSEKPKGIKSAIEKTCSPIKTSTKSSKSITSRPKSKKQDRISAKNTHVPVIMIKEPSKNNFISGSELAMDEAKKKARENSGPTICTDSINFLESFTAIVSKQNLMFPSYQKPQPKKSISILKAPNNDTFNLNVTASDRSFNKKVRFQIDKSKITVSDTSVTLSTDEEYSTLYEETASEFSCSDQEIAYIMKLYMEYALLVHLQHTCFVNYHTSTRLVYHIITIYEQVTFIDMPENYDFEIICKKDNKSFSNLEPYLQPTEIVYKSDSLSDFIENCQEIIEATKKLDLRRKESPPEILKFLNIITSISVEHLGLKKELYYQIARFDAFLQHFSSVYFVSNTFDQIFYSIIFKKSTKINELGTLVPKSAPKFIIPFENIDAMIKQCTETSKIMPYQNMQLQKHFSEPEFSSEFLKYHIKIPFSEEIAKSHSDTKCLDVLTYNTRRRYETICQTLVLNLQVQNCGHRKTNISKNARKTIRKKYYIAPSKNKLQLKAIEVGFGLDTKKLLYAERTYKKAIIFLYITVFSLAFLCMTLNYKCE